jgi:hypothetical protein
MKLSQRFILSFNVVFFILYAVPREAHAWWSIYVGGDTHWDITKDVLDNKLADETLHLDVDYPDLLMFKDELMNGSNTESHNIPDGLATEWWWPSDEKIEKWFYSGNKTDGLYGYGALFAYTNYVIHSAYMNIGRELHLVQDQSVPAHKLYCCHGETKIDWDDLEKKASLLHFYGEPTEDWTYQFVHSGGVELFQYWLSDAMDDDDQDDVLVDIEDDEKTIPDGPTHDWGVTNTAWGTYGQPYFYNPGDHNYQRVLLEKITGHDEGMDYYIENFDTKILYGQLKLAYIDTLARLKMRSKELPPLIPNDDKYGRPSVSADIFGPNKPIVVDFIAMENRKPTVSVFVLAGVAGGIKDNISGKVWDGGANAKMDLLPSDTFPWKRKIFSNWNGDTATGQIDDGIHEISMQIKDQDTHLSEKRTLSVMYDKTKPIGTITVNCYPKKSYP